MSCATVASSTPTLPPHCSHPMRSGGPIWETKSDGCSVRPEYSRPIVNFADILAILPQQLVFGITLGTAYGLIAIGYTMVYGVLFMINFAHGDVFMIGAYVGWAMLGMLFASQVVPMNPIIVLPVLLIGAMVVTGAIGLLLERFAYRPLYQRGATRLGPLISAVGASIFLQNVVMLIAGAREKVYMTYAIFPRTWRFSLGSVSISVLVVVIASIAVAMM